MNKGIWSKQNIVRDKFLRPVSHTENHIRRNCAEQSLWAAAQQEQSSRRPMGSDLFPVCFPYTLDIYLYLDHVLTMYNACNHTELSAHDNLNFASKIACPMDHMDQTHTAAFALRRLRASRVMSPNGSTNRCMIQSVWTGEILCNGFQRIQKKLESSQETNLRSPQATTSLQ